MDLPKLYAQNKTKSDVDMTLSENMLGCPPAVMTALKDISMRDVSRYPDTSLLEDALARFAGVPGENVIAGAGSEQLIKLIAQSFLAPGKTAVIAAGSFSLFTKESVLAGASALAVPVKQMAAISPAPAVIFIANPTTPEGLPIPVRDILRIAEAFPETLVVVDEVIGEFSDDTVIPFLVDMRNIVVLKSLSKGFGLAGLRVGFAVGFGPAIRILRESRQPFPVSSVSAKLAVAALSDREFVQKTREAIGIQRKFLTLELESRGFEVSRSVTNNLFVYCPDAARLVSVLAGNGVAVIDGSYFPGMGRQGFRITVRDPETNREFLRRLDAAMDCMDGKKLISSKEIL